MPDLAVSMPAELSRYVVEKGSITVDGVSLTVVDDTDDGFTVAVIPHTAEVTTLGRRRAGDPVNLEVDVMAKYAERLLAAQLGYARTGPVPRRSVIVSREALEQQGSSGSVFAPIEDAVAAMAKGEIIVVVDDEDRENEGDLIMAAEAATPEKIAFFVRHTSGVICAPLEGDRLDELDIPLMVRENTESHRTAFTYSVDYVHGTSTGISAADRASTLNALTDPATRPTDLARPGHIFPLRYSTGGVLKRAGHTEAAVDLARMAGLYPAGVLCEIVNDDGTMARVPDLVEFCRGARPADDHDRPADQVPASEREAGQARLGGPDPDALRAISPATCTSRSSTGNSTSRSPAAPSRGRTTCWSGCTPSA